MAAGFGPGYVHSIFSEGKDPTVEKLLAICDAVPVSAAYILYGVELDDDDMEILRGLQTDTETRSAILSLMKREKP